MERLIDPVIADLQFEYSIARREGRTWRGRLALAAAYLAFWKVVAFHLSISAGHAVRGCIERDRRALGRMAGLTIVTTAALTGLFVLPPMLPFFARLSSDSRSAWLLALLLPQAIPLSLPPGLLAGVLWGLRGRPATRALRRAVLVGGLLTSVAMIGTIGWLMPAANQAFRVEMAGHDIVRGVNETPLVALRQHALDVRAQGQPDRAFSLLLTYHVRWALGCTAFGFALFGCALLSLQLTRLSTAGVAAMGVVGYITYFWQLDATGASGLHSESAAIALAWLPNIVLAGVSLLFLWSRRPLDGYSDSGWGASGNG
jgi:lipopolysaccharide export LptBFGC system permease protein LptF